MNSLIQEEFSDRFLASINSAVQTNEGHHSLDAASGHRGHRVCTHKHSRGEPFVPVTWRNVVQVQGLVKWLDIYEGALNCSQISAD